MRPIYPEQRGNGTSKAIEQANARKIYAKGFPMSRKSRERKKRQQKLAFNGNQHQPIQAASVAAAESQAPVKSETRSEVEKTHGKPLHSECVSRLNARRTKLGGKKDGIFALAAELDEFAPTIQAVDWPTMRAGRFEQLRNACFREHRFSPHWRTLLHLFSGIEGDVITQRLLVDRVDTETVTIETKAIQKHEPPQSIDMVATIVSILDERQAKRDEQQARREERQWDKILQLVSIASGKAPEKPALPAAANDEIASKGEKYERSKKADRLDKLVRSISGLPPVDPKYGEATSASYHALWSAMLPEIDVRRGMSWLSVKENREVSGLEWLDRSNNIDAAMQTACRIWRMKSVG